MLGSLKPRIQLFRFLKFCLCLCELPFCFQRHGQVIVSGRILGNQLDGSPKLGEGSFNLAPLEEPFH